jgi:hypothetical protein
MYTVHYTVYTKHSKLNTLLFVHCTLYTNTGKPKHHMFLAVLTVITVHHGAMHTISIVLIVSSERPNVEYRLLVTPGESSRYMFSVRLVETEVGLCKAHGMGCGL